MVPKLLGSRKEKSGVVSWDRCLANGESLMNGKLNSNSKKEQPYDY